MASSGDGSPATGSGAPAAPSAARVNGAAADDAAQGAPRATGTGGDHSERKSPAVHWDPAQLPQAATASDSMLLTTRLSEYPIKHDLQEYQFDRAAPVNPVVKALKFLAPMFPPAKWASRYTRKDAMGDLMAGVTVGLMVVPQSLAYATIAELPYEYGLFSSFMGVFIYCALGTSRDVSVGPTAIISLLVAVEAQGNPARATALALMSGVIQMAVGMLKLGAVFDLVSPPVLTGFVSASAITIGVGQIKDVLGLKGIGRDFTSAVRGLWNNIGDTNGYDAAVGVLAMLLVALLKWWGARSGDTNWVVKGLATARNAVVVMLATVVAAILGAAMGDDFTAAHPFTLIGDMPAGLPEPTVPDVDFALVMPAFVIAIVAFLESFSIASAFGRKNGYPVNANQELFALGAANAVSSVFRAYPITGSFSRSSVNASSGVRTPAGGVATGIIVMLCLQWFTPVFYYVPKAALAAVIIMSVVRLVEWHEVPHLWARDREDLLVAVVSFLLCLLINTEYGIIAGAAIAIFFLLYHTARPKYAVVRGGGFSSAESRPEAGAAAVPGDDGSTSSAGASAQGADGVGGAAVVRPGDLRAHNGVSVHDVLVTTPFQFQPGVETGRAVVVPGGWGNQRRVLIPLGTIVFTLHGPLVAACTTHFTQALQAELNIVRGRARPRFLVGGPDAAARRRKHVAAGADASSSGSGSGAGDSVQQGDAASTGGGSTTRAATPVTAPEGAHASVELTATGAGAGVGAGAATGKGGTTTGTTTPPAAVATPYEHVIDIHLDDYGPGAPGYANLVLDMACVPWVDSAGLTALETVIKAAAAGVYSGAPAAAAGEAEAGPTAMAVYLCGLCTPVWRQLRRSKVLFKLVARPYCCPTVRAAVEHIRGHTIASSRSAYPE